MSPKEFALNDKVSGAPSTESKDSVSPLLKPTEPIDIDPQKPRKRDFWKFGKKQPQDDMSSKARPSVAQQQQQQQQAPTSGRNPMVGVSPASPSAAQNQTSGSVSPPQRQVSGNPASPALNASPRPQSPASSMIFERNVQDEVVHPETSPHLPSHVLTENHIAPALDASAQAITNEKLNPDEVEIVTHVAHQPAAVTITGVQVPESALVSPVQEESPPQRYDTDTGSNYGSIDATDVRRLSFISFADVVHGEQEFTEGRRDSALLSGLNPIAIGAPRSPSPIRSPVSSAAFGTSPPTSVSASMKGFDTSPHRASRGTVSPLPGQSSPLALGSEINVETMRQALRKTGSGDMSSFRSAPVSAIGNDDGAFDRSFR